MIIACHYSHYIKLTGAVSTTKGFWYCTHSRYRPCLGLPGTTASRDPVICLVGGEGSIEVGLEAFEGREEGELTHHLVPIWMGDF